MNNRIPHIRNFEKDRKPPVLQVTIVYAPGLPDYTYRITVSNEGEETVSAANIKMTLYQDEKTKESGIFTINYVLVK